MKFSLKERAGIPNRNGRVYPKEIFENIDNTKIPVLLGSKSTEIDILSIAGFSSIDEIDKDGNVMISIQTVDTPNGKILESLIKDNIKMEFSTNGVGICKKENDWISDILGRREIIEDFKLLSINVNLED